jgi:hypothetical protein
VLVLCFVVVAILLSSCKNSIDADEIEETSSSSIVMRSSDESSSSRVSSSSLEESSSSSTPPYPESFKPDDKEYPYAGIPRIVIETENRQAIVDRETEIPAKMQIWGDSTAVSEIMDLTIRGRGNSSWTDMPKKSYKIEFEKKQSMLDMPKDKDWALIANYADKTLMRNYLMYNLSANLGAYYSPRCEFVELYINEEYLGVYLLTETIKIGKNRVDIPNSDDSYIVEMRENYRNNQQIVFSYGLKVDSSGKPFRIHAPKNATSETLAIIQEYLQNFEEFLSTIKPTIDNDVEKWIDIDEFIKYYWAQEFSKNPDARDYSSIFFSWEKKDIIKMGPVWDFDLAFGNDNRCRYSEGWFIENYYWYSYLLQDSRMKDKKRAFWIKNKEVFFRTQNAIDSIFSILLKSANNNFKKWDILNSTDNPYLASSYLTYNEAVDDLKQWVVKRFEWIDAQIE